MRTVMVAMLLVVLGVVEGTAAADALLVGRVTDLLDRPVPNIRVHVLSPDDHQIVTTDQDGQYRVVVDGYQQIAVVVGAGNFHTFRGGTIKDGATQRLDFQLEIAEGEIIRIVDGKPPTVPPKLPPDASRLTPPYSDEAIVRDAWAKAWLLLDVSETGKVLRVKLVKRPGFGLDEIAVQEAMKLKFEPALDEAHKPMRTMIYWAMEWPSYGWLTTNRGTAARMPVESYAIDPFKGNFGGLTLNMGENTLAYVPCAGSGPLNLDQLHPVYRDCSKPNAAKVRYLPWLDGTAPIPPDAPEIARKPDPPLHLSRASYIPQIAASTVSLGLVVATVVSYSRFNKYTNRLLREYELWPIAHEIPDAEQVRSDQNNRDKWTSITLAMSATAVISCVFTTSLWLRHQRRADFSVQPEDGGAKVLLGGSF